MSTPLRPALLALLVACGGETPAPVPSASTPVAAPAPVAAAAPETASDARSMADAMFNDAMRAHETGDAENAKVYLPQAIAAYRALPTLDADGHFHLALLQIAAGDPAAARATVDETLASQPEHLLALGAGARAATAAGDTAAAVDYHRRLLAAYDAQAGAAPEYQHHARLLPKFQDEAREAVALAIAGSAGVTP